MAGQARRGLSPPLTMHRSLRCSNCLLAGHVPRSAESSSWRSVHIMKSFDLVVASHLRWSFVWQRPQQLLSRLARHHRILFVEEPISAPDGVTAPRPALNQAMPDVFTLTPQVDAALC